MKVFIIRAKTLAKEGNKPIGKQYYDSLAKARAAFKLAKINRYSTPNQDDYVIEEYDLVHKHTHTTLPPCACCGREY